jgi:hypothetical protein
MTIHSIPLSSSPRPLALANSAFVTSATNLSPFRKQREPVFGNHTPGRDSLPLGATPEFADCNRLKVHHHHHPAGPDDMNMGRQMICCVDRQAPGPQKPFLL